jgi:hypothetical protein
MLRTMSARRGEDRECRGRAATAASRFGLVALLAAAAVLFVGCSSTAKPAGSGGNGVGGAANIGGMNGTGIGGMTGAGGTGVGGHEAMDAHVIDAPATSDAGDAGDAGDSGDSGDQCSLGKPCHTNGDCCQSEWCFIGAVITDCASAPVGVCTAHRGGNCGTHANICDCFAGIGAGVSCTSFPGTQCHSVSDTNMSLGDCFACVPCGGSGQDCCNQGGSLGLGSCNSGLTCSGGTASPKCMP